MRATYLGGAGVAEGYVIFGIRFRRQRARCARTSNAFLQFVLSLAARDDGVAT